MEPIREAEMQTQPGKRLNEESKKNGKVWKIVVGVVAAAVVVFFGACCILAHASTAFFPHTAINGVDVSGLTLQEAQSRLETVLPQRVCKIYLSEQNTASPEEREPAASITFAELGVSPEAGYDGMAKSAYILQHGKGYCSTGFTYLKSLLGKNTGYNSSLYWDSRQLDQAIARLSAVLNSKPLDMAFQVGDHSLQLTMAKDGQSVADNELRRSIQNVVQVSSEPEAIVDLPAEILPAKALTAQQLHDQLHGEVRNASYDSATDTIVPEQLGADFDIAAVQKAMDEAAPGETLTVKADIQQPEVTAADLKAVLFRDVLGEAKTHVSGSAGRIGNVKLSAQIINGLVLNSGETFSYNGSVGKRTADRGFKPAPAYVKGETVDEIGGGICQTSSTLYLACLLSNLEITERYAHRYVPAYITAGMDATVSWGGPDYKFTNNSLYPIKIVTIYENNYLTVRILGTNVDGTSVKMTNEHLSTTPYETVYEDDPTLAPGTEKVKTTPYTGYKYRTYRNVYDANGKLISSAYEATSDYKSRNKVILRGPAVEPADGGAQIPTDTTEPTTPVEPTEPQDPGVPTEPAEPGAPDGGWTIQTPEQDGQQTAEGQTGTGTTGESELSTDVLPQDEPFV